MGQIDVIMADLDDHLESDISALALECEANLTEATPIDIGWARAGWVPSVGKPYGGGADLTPESVQVSIALARKTQGQAEVINYQLAQGDIFISNNVVYIQRLNDGWSKQAPSGFVQATLDQTVRRFAG